MRINKIYTRTGDQGQTFLASGDHVAKNHPIVEICGQFDELNCFIGLMLAELMQSPLFEQAQEWYNPIQHHLFDIGGAINCNRWNDQLASQLKNRVELLENQIDQITDSLPELKSFILPGGSKELATCHIARSQTRKLERNWILSAIETPLNANITMFLNRLSDHLFAFGRYIAQKNHTAEVLWQPLTH